MAERIQMPFRVVSRVGRGMSVLDGGGYRRGEGEFRVNVGRPIVINGVFVA